MHSKKCQSHLSSCLCPAQREDEQIKKHVAFMGWFNLNTCGQSCKPLFLEEESLIKFLGPCLTGLLLSDRALLSHGPWPSGSMVTFKAKVTAASENGRAFLHYSPGY